MSLHSLSTSSSEIRRGLGRQWRFTPLLAIIGWAIAGLAAIDILVGLAFRYPTDPTTPPSRLQSFFEYGRSTESSLKRMTRPDASQSAPITLSGWYEPLSVTEVERQPGTTASRASKPIITIYGGSHSVRLANALGRVSQDLAWRSVGAPGATSNWSYGAFLRDRDGVGKSEAVVLTFNTNLLPAITSFSPAMWNFDSPMPYAADRFYLKNGQLKVIPPPYGSFKEYQRTLSNPQKWSQVVSFFARNDPLFSSLTFRSNILENSALIRIMRRAYNTRRHKEIEQAVFSRTEFNPESEAIQVARAIIGDFATRARAEGKTPVIFLVNDFGYSDVLFRALKPALDADAVPYISSHDFISPNDPNGYLPDSHFTDANDDRLAIALEKIVARERCGSARPVTRSRDPKSNTCL